MVRRLWREGLVTSLTSLYRLTKEQLLELDGFAEVSASNAVEAIAASKERPLFRVLYGLSIPDVGWVTAQQLARHFRDVDRLMEARQEEIQEAEGIGPERAGAIAEWFAEEENRKLVEELRELGLRLEIGEEDRPVEGPLTGSTYVITGTLEAFSRDEAAARLEALGAKVGDSVSSKTTALIVGESPGGSKVKGAQKHGTTVLSEEELLALLNAHPEAAAPRRETPPPRRR
jgi:DNA ligase (NAD+)